MKAITIIYTTGRMLAGCGSKELDRGSALELLKKEKDYPRMVEYDIFCADPAHARKLLDAGLEEKGLVTVQRTQKLSDAGSPRISFTEAAKPYLLPTVEKDRKLDIQKVRLAEEVLQSVVSVQPSGEGKSGDVVYETAYTRLTPFSVLRTNPTDKKTHTARFVLTGNGWQIEKRH